MSSKCSGFGMDIYSLQYMECSNMDCKKTYDLNCIAMQSTEFEGFCQDYKDKWICPECTSLKRKSDNSNTPVRGNIAASLGNIYTPTDFVNTQRGSRHKKEIAQDRDYQLITEMRQFRFEVMARLEKQADQFQQIVQEFCETRNEIREIDRKLTVLEENVAKNKQIPQPIPPIVGLDIQQLRKSSSTKEDSYSSILQTKKYVRPKKVSAVDNKVGATKNSILPLKANNLAIINIDEVTNSKHRKTEGEWKEVTNKKRKQKVRKGESTSFGIQALGKKKHLHVWCLLPETTLEQIKAHVKSICGDEVNVNIEKITHKTERGYASFIVGVPERCFETVSQTSVWPRDAEFSEWIWFRRSSKSQGK